MNRAFEDLLLRQVQPINASWVFGPKALGLFLEELELPMTSQPGGVPSLLGVTLRESSMVPEHQVILMSGGNILGVIRLLPKETRRAVQEKREAWLKVAEPVGSMHSYWDLIGTADTILKGGPPTPYYSVEEFLRTTP